MIQNGGYPDIESTNEFNEKRVDQLTLKLKIFLKLTNYLKDEYILVKWPESLDFEHDNTAFLNVDKYKSCFVKKSSYINYLNNLNS